MMQQNDASVPPYQLNDITHPMLSALVSSLGYISQGHMTLSHGTFSTKVDLSLYAYNHQPYDVSQ